MDFGLDAAAARSNDNHASVLGRRIIGLVSRMIVMNDRVPIQEFSKVPSMQEKDDIFGNLVPTTERGNLDTTIPKLSLIFSDRIRVRHFSSHLSQTIFSASLRIRDSH